MFSFNFYVRQRAGHLYVRFINANFCNRDTTRTNRILGGEQMKKILFIILSVILFLGNFHYAAPVYASETTNAYDKTNVLEDLQNATDFNIRDYPFQADGTPQIIISSNTVTHRIKIYGHISDCTYISIIRAVKRSIRRVFPIRCN